MVLEPSFMEGSGHGQELPPTCACMTPVSRSFLLVAISQASCLPNPPASGPHIWNEIRGIVTVKAIIMGLNVLYLGANYTIFILKCYDKELYL